jgi:Cu+-exporting ATPase
MKGDLKLDVECAYCGDPCLEDKIVINASPYCCYGCATLDDVVSKITISEDQVSIQYKQFDVAERFDQLVDFQNQKVYKISIDLPSIHCSSCVELLEDLPAFHKDIMLSNVNFEQRKATVVAKKALNLSILAQLLDDIGYPPRLSLGQKQKQAEKQQQRRDLFKMAFAGFCFGNTMFYAMPHYFGLNAQIDPFFSNLFLILSVILSIPVMFYAGIEYLSSAYKALAASRIHINVPIAIGMLSLWVWSLYEIINGIGPGYLDSLSGLIFFLLVGKWFQTKIYDQVSFQRHIAEFIPLVVRKVGPSGVEWTELAELNKGDVVEVKSNEIIPVEGKLISDFASVDYSFITGEEIPEEVLKGAMVYTGGKQLGATVQIELKEEPDVNTIWSNWSQHSKREHVMSWTNKISRYFTFAVLGIALLAGVVWYFIDPSQIPFVCSAILIVACPCALALSAPFTYGAIIRVFSKNGFYVKDAASIQTLSKVDRMVFDKTGTLTKTNEGYIEYNGVELKEEIRSAVASLAGMSNHPMSQLIAKTWGPSGLKVAHFEEYVGNGLSGEVNELYLRIGAHSWFGLDNEERGTVALEIDGKVMGSFRIKPHYREQIAEVLEELGSAYSLAVLSGDNDNEKEQLLALYPGFESLHFELKPKDKAKLVQDRRGEGTVAMIGDGLNDGIALEQSDFGIAMTESLNGFYPGADAVLLGSQFRAFPKFMKLANYSKQILKFGLLFSLLYNFVGLGFAVSGALTPIVAAILMPLSSISVVILNTSLVRLNAKKLKLK